MPLQISKPTKYAIPATYWRIDQHTIDRRNSQMVIAIGGYISAAAAAVPLVDPLIQITIPVAAGGFNAYMNAANNPAWLTVDDVNSTPIYNHLVNNVAYFAGAVTVP